MTFILIKSKNNLFSASSKEVEGPICLRSSSHCVWVCWGWGLLQQRMAREEYSEKIDLFWIVSFLPGHRPFLPCLRKQNWSWASGCPHLCAWSSMGLRWVEVSGYGWAWGNLEKPLVSKEKKNLTLMFPFAMVVTRCLHGNHVYFAGQFGGEMKKSV